MTLPRVERRPTAILAAGIVGYSRLMGADAAGTLEVPLLAELRELRPEDREHLIDGFRKVGLAA
jgi:class 3 adenylate cyclase